MIILSPELTSILKRIPISDTVVINFKTLRDYKGKSFPKRLVRNLRTLEYLGVLKITYLTSVRVELSILDRKFVELLRRLVSSFGADPNVELNFTALRVLSFLCGSPYARDIRFISGYLGITSKGVRKILSKLISFGLIDECYRPTQVGSEFLSVVCRNRDFCNAINIRINPFLTLRTIETAVTPNIVHSLVVMVRSIIDLNKRLGTPIEDVVLFGLNSDSRIITLLRSISKKLKKSSMVMPIIIDEDKLCDMIIKLGTKYCELVGTQKIDMLDSPEFHNLRILIESFRSLALRTPKTFFVGLVPPIIAYTLDTYFTLKSTPETKINLFLIPLIDEEIPHVEKDARRVFNKTRKLHKKIREQLTQGEPLYVFWNDGDSYIKIEPPTKMHELPERTIRIEDGALQDMPQYIPIGEIRVDLCELSKIGAEISGKIRLRGEPIVGLKTPSKDWLGGLEEPEATFYIEIHNRKPTLTLVDARNNILGSLDQSYLCQLHIGTLETKTREIREIISPILTRTRLFLHFWIINRKNKTYHQIIVKNAKIKNNRETLWETIKL